MIQEGQQAPEFRAQDQQNNTITLGDFKGKKLVIFFYPEDDTPTCTQQACNLRDNYALLREHGYEVIGVSPDPVEKHARYQEKHQLPFTLLADPEHSIINAYGVWGEKNMYGRKYMGLFRTTFVVNEQGEVIHVFRKPKVKQHAEEIIAKTSGK
jgi:peroxiredoxin Q/BCP